MTDILKTLFKRKDNSFSKTKVGAVLVVIGPILFEFGKFLQGEIDANTLLNLANVLAPYVGALLVALGIRDKL